MGAWERLLLEWYLRVIAPHGQCRAIVVAGSGTAGAFLTGEYRKRGR